jgi:hypothetical protein
MADVPESLKDEVRDLIAKGWTPPAEVLRDYVHLLRPFNQAKGWSGKLDKLDDCDVGNLKALIAVFDHFGIPLPVPKPEPVIVREGTRIEWQ